MEELTKFHVDWKKIVVVGLLVVLTGLISGGGAWYAMDTFKDTELEVKDEEIATLNTRISELEAEVSEEGETISNEVNTGNDITVTEMKIKIPLNEPLFDLEYIISADLGSAYFSTKRLSNYGQWCATSEAPLGKLIKTTEEPLKVSDANYEPSRSENALVKKIGDYYYYYIPPQATCSDNKSAQALQTAQIAAIKEQIKKIESL